MSVILNSQKRLQPFQTDIGGKHSVVVCVNWDTNRNRQTRLLDTRKVAQQNLLRKVVTGFARTALPRINKSPPPPPPLHTTPHPSGCANPWNVEYRHPFKLLCCFVVWAFLTRVNYLLASMCTLCFVSLALLCRLLLNSDCCRKISVTLNGFSCCCFRYTQVHKEMYPSLGQL